MNIDDPAGSISIAIIIIISISYVSLRFGRITYNKMYTHKGI